MNHKLGSPWLLAALAAFAMVVAACGHEHSRHVQGNHHDRRLQLPEAASWPSCMGQALAHDGYTVSYKLNLGNREVVSVAIMPARSTSTRLCGHRPGVLQQGALSGLQAMPWPPPQSSTRTSRL
jgi:hypothetical protein